MLKILRNSVKCRKCGVSIESKSVFGMIECKCGAVAITGGKKFLNRSGKEDDFVETSLVEVTAERKVE